MEEDETGDGRHRAGRGAAEGGCQGDCDVMNAKSNVFLIARRTAPF